MSLFGVFDVSGSAMSAQMLRLNTTASNMANVDSIASRPEEAYKARHPVFQEILQQSGGVGVQTQAIVESQAPAKARYEPDNPMADEQGYVYAPNVNMVEEMVNMISASRSYQTNVEMMNTSKDMILKTLSLGQ
ncbi:MAG: flagellar basal body rod protein FlgC [Halothiobacillaceae bacterium]|jgi:flagellar basal-body rod protein FlgC|nr:flagellar basal body rod protein FlgC [Halothiobacillaceae bacterium]